MHHLSVNQINPDAFVPLPCVLGLGGSLIAKRPLPTRYYITPN